MPNSALSVLTRWALAALVMAAAPRARAQRGIDVELEHLALDTSGIFGVERAEVSHPWEFSFQLLLDYTRDPLSLRMIDAAAQRPVRRIIMDRLVALHLGLTLGLTPWLEVGADLPIASASYTSAYGRPGSAAMTMPAPSGFYAAEPRTNVPPPDASPLDILFGLKSRLLRRGAFGVAAAALVSVPLGDETAFLGDSGFTFRPIAIGDFTHGAVTVAANLGLIIRRRTRIFDPVDLLAPARRPAPILEVGNEVVWSLGASYRVYARVGIEAELHGTEPIGVSRDATGDRTASLIGGAVFFLGGELALRLGLGTGLVPSSRRAGDLRVLVGVAWSAVERRPEVRP